jgi:heme oxygenase
MKEATKGNHSSVEKVLVTKLKNLSSEGMYAQLLIQLLGFYSSLEKAVHQQLSAGILPDIEKRLHVINIKQDLDNLGFKNIPNVTNPFSIQIDTVSKAIGVLYVIEGSTLGGQVIGGMLKKQIPTLQDDKINYFLSYHEQTMPMWKDFKNTIEEKADSFDEAVAIQTAKETFDALKNWLTIL